MDVVDPALEIAVNQFPRFRIAVADLEGQVADRTAFSGPSAREVQQAVLDSKNLPQTFVQTTSCPYLEG
jgi:hypothetical protein